MSKHMTERELEIFNIMNKYLEVNNNDDVIDIISDLKALIFSGYEEYEDQD